MQLVLLMKAVPPLEALRYDPDRRTMLRAGVPLLANPFDARALAALLRQRRPEDRVTVLSMGPAEAARPLSDALGFGADRAILVSDAALAGSDALVTSRVLAAALRALTPDLVLAGRASTDSDTALVPALVAARLGWPVTGPARSVGWTIPGEPVRVTVEEDEGNVEVELPTPAVVAIGEKIGKPLKAAEGAGGSVRPVERWAIADLSLRSEAVGLEGSPTRVVSIHPVAPDRAGRTFAAVDLTAAVEAIAERLTERPRPPVRAGDSSSERLGGAGRQALVLVSDRYGVVERAALPLLAEVRRQGVGAVAVGVGAEPRLAELEGTGASALAWAVSPEGPVDPDSVASSIRDALGKHPGVEAVLSASSDFGRETLAALAAGGELGIVGDATGMILRGPPPSPIAWEKPAFGEGHLAEIECRRRPVLVTVRPGAFAPDERPTRGAVPLERLAPLRSGGSPYPRERRPAPPVPWGDPSTAQTLLVVGMGLGGPEELPGLEPVRRALGAALVGTRRVVDAGWLPTGRQVGLTGRAFAPELALLVGVSGSPNHLVGLRRARVIVAINSDPEAPVFRGSDVGLVGRWQELLPMLSAALARVRPAAV
jgi:electron transfer flavoprotein alpha subunit